jgi:superfamily II DNA or RNA helicase
VVRVVIVVPTTALRRQWAKAGAAVGISLSHQFLNEHDHEHAQFHGVVVTYAQVASNPDVFRRQCRRATLVIFDEPHHMGDSLLWGDALQHAFEHAQQRLLITGTPFRSDNHPIPFVRYIDGKCRAHFTYTYGDALRDGVVRPVYFPSYEGQMKWFSARDGQREATFRDELDEQESMQRLRTALSTQADWLPTVLRDADARLRDVRESVYSRAAGLVIAMDQVHARSVADLLHEITGEHPSVALSDDPNAGDVIEAFRQGQERWIVAVRMVSEGIDIPRLFVGVYATNVLTEMYFRQAVGRLVRLIAESGELLDGEAGWWFIPREPLLVAYVQRIKEQREHALDEAEQQEHTCTATLDPDKPRQSNLAVTIGATAEADDVFFDHDLYTRQEIARAELILGLAGTASVSAPFLARCLRLNAQLDGGAVSAISLPTSGSAAVAPEDALRKAKQPLSRLTSRFVATTGLTHAQVYRLQASLDGAWLQGNRITLAQIEARERLMKELLARTQDPWAPTDYEGWLEAARAEYARC